MLVKLCKILTMSACVFIICFSSIAQTVQEDIAQGRLPFPSDAENIYGPAVKTRRSVGSLIVYKTSLNKKQLIKFYAKELAKRGWESKRDTASDVVKRLDVPVKNKVVMGREVNVNELLKNIIYFHRNDKTLMLTVLPKGLRQRGTFFSLSYIRKDFDKSTAFSEDIKLPDSIPIYPDAQPLSSLGSTYLYSSTDGIESVTSFYRERMLAYGWDLVDETPLEQRKIEVPASLSQKGSFCPDCPDTSSLPPEVTAELAKGVYMLKAELNFTKGKREKCKIYITKLDNPTLSSGTQINIRYYD